MEELESHLRATGYAVEMAERGQETYLLIRDFRIDKGARAGSVCDVGILRTAAQPWVPPSAVHVRPHLVAMGQAASQASNLGGDWQYLSRRFDKPPTPKLFLAHILTVLGEL